MQSEEKQKMEAAFERYDRLKDFENRLSSLINNLGVDNLLNVPDYVLASTAVQQMELTASILRCAKKHPTDFEQ